VPLLWCLLLLCAYVFIGGIAYGLVQSGVIESQRQDRAEIIGTWPELVIMYSWSLIRFVAHYIALSGERLVSGR
jgi:hypothetical protein